MFEFTHRKQTFLKAIAHLLFKSGALNVLNRIANQLRCNYDGAGKLAFPFVRRRSFGNVQILVYHRVNDDRDPFFPGTPVKVFRQQMEYLAANYNVTSLEDAVDGMVRKDVPDNVVVITFDDGYRDNYINAFPILKDLSLPATIFLATDSIGSGRALWHDRVFSAFRRTSVAFLEGFGTSSSKYRLATIDEKLFAQQEVLNFLRSRDDGEREFWIDFLIDKLEVTDCCEAPGLMLSWEEANIMHNSGVSFGSHTVTHPILSKLPYQRAREEIERSKDMIEARLHVPVKTFAYPNGRTHDFNECTKRLLKQAGYICALTTNFGANEIDQDLFELRRATPWDHDICTFGARLNYYKFAS
jgi:peptidoglycan/xylan/chitin deacetylase (PgdA/CDA1 family)